jgi:hypothetical protein
MAHLTNEWSGSADLQPTTAQMGMAAGLSLIQVAAFAPEQITHERLAAIAAALATL